MAAVSRAVPGVSAAVLGTVGRVDGADDRCEDFRAVAELAEAFRAMVQLLTERDPVGLDVQALVEFAHSAMPRAQHTGLLLLARGEARTVAASSDVPERLDRLRAEIGEGPALDVLETNDMVISGDVASDPRWPSFGPRALQELDVRSIACYRLHLGPDHRAALVFVSDWPYAFDELTGAIGAIFAAYCSLMLFTEEVLGDKLTSARAVEVHREIGVAVGILLADEELSSDQAYRRLHEASRALSTSLPDVARHVIAHRGLPGT
jgi:hypothetical protein